MSSGSGVSVESLGRRLRKKSVRFNRLFPNISNDGIVYYLSKLNGSRGRISSSNTIFSHYLMDNPFVHPSERFPQNIKILVEDIDCKTINIENNDQSSSYKSNRSSRTSRTSKTSKSQRVNDPPISRLTHHSLSHREELDDRPRHKYTTHRSAQSKKALPRPAQPAGAHAGPGTRADRARR